MAHKKKTQTKTIFVKLFYPIMSVLVLQAVFFVCIFFFGGMQGQLQKNAVEILREKTINRRIYLETEMNGRWSNITESYEKVLGIVEDTLKEEGADIDDVRSNPALNEKIAMNVTQQVIYMIRKNGVTGGFVVLYGLGNEQIPDSFSGIYLRNPNPDAYATDNSDLLVEYGMPEISKQMGLPLDSYWSPYFMLDEKQEKYNYFYRPIRAAQRNVGVSGLQLGYWSPLFSLNDTDISVITYSVPLVYSDGTIFGVLGIEVSESVLASMLLYDELADDKAGSYFLGMKDPEDGGYRKFVTTGPDFLVNYGSDKVIAAEPAPYPDIVEAAGTAKRGTELLGGIQSLHLYGNNSPYESDEWVLIGFAGKDVLFAFSNIIRNNIFLCVLLSFVIGICSVALANRRVVQPITILIRELKSMNPYKKIRLKATNIEEVDKLASTVEELSSAVAESSSKLSRIISMTDLHIGAFEYKMTGDFVYCNEMFFELLNLDKDGWDGSFLDRTVFEQRMKELDQFLVKDTEGLFQLKNAFGSGQYVRYRDEKDGDSIIGTVIDITKDIEEKLRIEKERDFDGLTGLYNQSAFRRLLSELFAEPDRIKNAVMVMWDLDNLKYMNDNYGHEAGDDYIKKLAEQLKRFELYGGIIARRSGDEFFTFLYSADETEEKLEEKVRRIWMQMKDVKIVLQDGKNFKLKVSAGMSRYPEDTQDMEILIKYADFAMYCVKHNKKGNIQNFDKRLYQDNSILINGQEALHELIDRRLLRFAMQPVLEVATCRIYGYEMLMRPQTEPFHSPSDVLRIAKAQSKLYEIEYLTLFLGMETFAACVKNKEIAEDCKVFINSIADQKLSEEDELLLEERYQKFMASLVIEITESEPLDQEYTNGKLLCAKRWKAQLAIDDYGSGYSSEASLLNLSPDLVKVDMSIIRGIDHDPNRVLILDNLISYAKSKDIKILAEGVENEREMRVLVEHGVNYLQGYYIGRPDFNVQKISAEVLEKVRAAYDKQN